MNPTEFHDVQLEGTRFSPDMVCLKLLCAVKKIFKKKNNFFSFKCQGNISTLGPYTSITSKNTTKKEKKIYTTVTCKIGKRQATLQRFFFLMNGKLFYNSF